MINIIFVAPPAAGKGTQSSLISQKYNIPHISVGALLRNEVSNNTGIGEKIKNDLRLGLLISTDIIAELLAKRIAHPDCKNGYILDGFPRNREQIEPMNVILSKIKSKITHVFLIDIDKELAKKRTIGRLVCTGCGNNYNNLFEDSKPKFYSKCDYCTSTLSKREDDSEETFENRYLTYMNETYPLIEYFDNLGILYKIDGTISKDYTFSQITEILDGYINGNN